MCGGYTTLYEWVVGRDISSLREGFILFVSLRLISLLSVLCYLPAGHRWLTLFEETQLVVPVRGEIWPACHRKRLF